MRVIKDKYRGNPIEERMEFAELIVKLQNLNGGVCSKGQKVTEIIPLPEPDNTKLWEHLYHWATLYIGLPNTQDILKEIYGNASVENGDESFGDVCEDCKLHIMAFVYKYFWRKWTKEKDPEYKLGILISTAQWGFYEWARQSHNQVRKDLFCRSEWDTNVGGPNRGRKVCTRNIDFT